jgi:DNA-binding transcriptional ArsR family regulator
VVPGVEYIEAEDVRRSPFRVAVSPLPSLHSAMREAAGGHSTGMPRAWSDAIRRHLRSDDSRVLAPFLAPGHSMLPDPVVGLTDPPGESLKEGIERMMATSEDEVAAEIDGCAATGNAPYWREAQRDPARWLRRYAGCLLRAWKGFGPVWRRARPTITREVERVGTAAALDAQLELLDGLLLSAGVQQGRWYAPCEFYEGRHRFPDSGVILMPMVTGERGSLLARWGDVMQTIGYPVRGLNGDAAGDPHEASLEALLGAPRADILRALARPTNIGRLAERLRVVPSAATHHVGALEAAGLVARERSGVHVLVRRTARGETLLELYEELTPGWRSAPRRRF